MAHRFVKDAADEAFLAHLNRVLAPYEDQGYRELPERLPILYVIGCPRSGTTLMSQVICAGLDVGYINHLIAAFWRAPVHGIKLSRKLGLSRRSSFESEFGRTERINEPHEFGYFWSWLLDYPQARQKTVAEAAAIDWKRVRLVLLNMVEAFDVPMTFKSFYVGWHIEDIQRALKRSYFVWVRRDPVDIALSLLRMRREYLGSVEAWSSLRPAQFEQLRQLPYWEQVAGQAFYIEQAIGAQVSRVEGRNVIQVFYEDLCRDPRRVLADVKVLLEANGKVQWGSQIPGSFPVSRPTPASDEEQELVRDAVTRFYAGRWP